MSGTITLAGRGFEIRPLKLGQLRRLLDALEGMTGKSGGALVEAAADIVVAGLGPAHPDLTRDAVLDLEVTLDELNAAVAAILQIAGLKSAGEARPVTSPGETPGNSLAPFTAPSSPAAAVPIA